MVCIGSKNFHQHIAAGGQRPGQRGGPASPIIHAFPGDIGFEWHLRDSSSLPHRCYTVGTYIWDSGLLPLRHVGRLLILSMEAELS